MEPAITLQSFHSCQVVGAVRNLKFLKAVCTFSALRYIDRVIANRVHTVTRHHKRVAL